MVSFQNEAAVRIDVEAESPLFPNGLVRRSVLLRNADDRLRRS